MEKFATTYEHTINALGALGSLGAVVVSLVLGFASTQQMKPKIKASIAIWMSADDSIPPRLHVRLANIGNVPVTFDSNLFSWKVPFNAYWLITPIDATPYDFRRMPEYPVKLEQNEAKFIVLQSLDQFDSMFTEVSLPKRFRNDLAIRFMQPYVTAVHGQAFKVKVGSGIKKRLIAFSKKRQPAPPAPPEPIHDFIPS